MRALGPTTLNARVAPRDSEGNGAATMDMMMEADGFELGLKFVFAFFSIFLGDHKKSAKGVGI